MKFWFMSTAAVFAATALWMLSVVEETSAQTAPPAPPRWVFERPPPQDAFNREYQEVGTLVVKVGEDYELCWYNPITKKVGTKNVEETALQIAHRRYRVEGGKTEISQVLQFADWKPKLSSTGTPIPKNYCAKMKGVARAGHWVTEAQICRTPYVSDAESCSAWMSSIERYTPSGGGGTLDGVPRGWWIYAYIPAPTGVGT